MAIELQVSSVTALVTSEPRERQIYDGRGDNRTVKGRFTDGEGRPVSHGQRGGGGRACGAAAGCSGAATGHPG